MSGPFPPGSSSKAFIIPYLPLGASLSYVRHSSSVWLNNGKLFNHIQQSLVNKLGQEQGV